MNYPLISEYIEAIRSAEDNFDKLTNLRPVLDGNGNPIMSSGNFAVVFKMEDVETGKLYAVKCFTREQEHRNDNYQKIAEELKSVSSPYLVQFSFWENELFVDTTQSDEEEFPVLMMDWVNGVPLDVYLRIHLADDYERQMLAYRFCQMGAWLLSQPFAHGDLKPDNILVKQDGTLVLVDYDGMYVPSMQGQKAQELGTPDYRHPLRTEKDFNIDIDDFPIASIALSLKAIDLQPSLYEMFATIDHILFTAADYKGLHQSTTFQAVLSLISNQELSTLLSVFFLAYSRKSLKSLSSRIFIFDEPEYLCQKGCLTTNIEDDYVEDDIEITDEFGVTYSSNGKKLIRAKKNLISYKIKEGTIDIADEAFSFCQELREVIIPNSVTTIGKEAFSFCKMLHEIILPNTITRMGKGVFNLCEGLDKVIIPNSILEISEELFFSCEALREISLPNSIVKIDACAFSWCKNLKNISIPYSVKEITSNPFVGCKNLNIECFSDKFHMEDNLLLTIDKKTIISCLSSSNCVSIPQTVEIIGKSAFCWCDNVRTVLIPHSVQSIEAMAFYGCKKLEEVRIPSSVKSIGESAFCQCKMRELSIPYGIEVIEEYTFGACKNLIEVTIPNTVISIGEGSFSSCEKLQEITIPESIKTIGKMAFYGCKKLQKIVIPNSVTKIGDMAFYNCSELQEVIIPITLTIIGDSVFQNCKALKIIKVPAKSLDKFRKLIPNYSHLLIGE